MHVAQSGQPGIPGDLERTPDNDPQPTPEVFSVDTKAHPLPEARASVNVRVTISGREVQWTLRDSDEARLATRLEALLARYPQPPPAPPAASPQRTGVQEIGYCAKHHVEMTLNDKNGKQWWSHHTAEGWCKGK